MSLLEALQKPQIELIISDALKNARDRTFKEFLSELEAKNQLAFFLNLKVGNVIKLKQITAVVDEEVEDEDDYKEKVMNVISEIDIKTHKLGLLSNEIKEKVGGNSKVLRKVLASLKNERKIWSTGKTQGMRWVLYKFKDKVEAEFLKG